MISSRRNILILTASIGSGHISMARAIAEALQQGHRQSVRVETVDFIKELANPATAATKTIYLGSLKLSPKIYELIFTHSCDKQWPVKLLNFFSAPFMQQKFWELMKEKAPTILVSTYPIWDMIIKKTWEKYGNGRLPFVSVVTDSINVHNAWLTGKPDFFIVPNEDTKVSLQNAGIGENKIKVFGTPVSSKFSAPVDSDGFLKKLGLKPDKKTFLFIISEGLRWSRIKKIMKKIQKSQLKGFQMIVIAATDESLGKKLAAAAWPWPTFVTGWTDEMHLFIKSADIVMTKAGACTVMECIHGQKPMIIADAIPGHEMGNVLLIQKYNLGVVLDSDVSNFDWGVEYILKHEELIKKNISTQQKPNAARDIAEFLATKTFVK